jgi:hypothetical protein
VEASERLYQSGKDAAQRMQAAREKDRKQKDVLASRSTSVRMSDQESAGARLHSWAVRTYGAPYWNQL